MRFELLGAYWFRRIWQRYLFAFGNHRLQEQLLQAMEGAPRIQLGFARMSEDLRQQLYGIHLRYVTRMRQAADPAPVGLAELIAGPALLSPEHIREGDWYIVEYSDRGRLYAPRQPAVATEIVFSTVGLSSDQDGISRQGRVVQIVPLAEEDPGLHVLLHALHYPQVDPRTRSDARPSAGGKPSISWLGENWLNVNADDGEMVLTRFARTGVQNLSSRKPAALSSVRSGRRQVAPVAQSMREEVPAARDPASGSAQSFALNPMASVSHGPQPFVGVNMIGAGNNIALYGREGIVAYVDFGAPLTANKNTIPPGVTDPCVCGDPLMILSHWDYDHYAMARKNGDALRRRWIAPQQVMGSVAARELYVRLLVEAPNGSALALWPDIAGGVPTHWPVPFGFIERGTGAPANDDCLAVHVRLQDDSAMLPSPDALSSTFASRIAPSMSASPASSRAIIVDNFFYGAAWIEAEVDARFHKFPVMLPVSTYLFEAEVPPSNSGDKVWLKPSFIAAARRVRARWIAPAGLPSPKHRRGMYVPVLPNGRVWEGGWGISAADFVYLGGCIVDFPTDAAGIPNDNVICISTDPWKLFGKQWAPANGTLHSPKKGQWKPVWGGDYWAVELPAAQAAALAPLPAGPVALVPIYGHAPVSAAESYVLLPGDAGYQHLPSMQARLAAVGSGKPTQNIVGMIATHHGAATWIPTDPAAALLVTSHIPPARAGKIVYSYGTRINGAKHREHCYPSDGLGHPHPTAINAYLAAGWGVPVSPVPFAFNRLNTAPYDFESKQPFNPLALAAGTLPNAANILGHYNGNVGLSLAPTPGHFEVRTCAHCKLTRRYFF